MGKAGRRIKRVENTLGTSGLFLSSRHHIIGTKSIDLDRRLPELFTNTVF